MASANSQSFGTRCSTLRERSWPHLKLIKCRLQLKVSQIHDSLRPKRGACLSGGMEALAGTAAHREPVEMEIFSTLPNLVGK